MHTIEEVSRATGASRQLINYRVRKGLYNRTLINRSVFFTDEQYKKIIDDIAEHPIKKHVMLDDSNVKDMCDRIYNIMLTGRVMTGLEICNELNITNCETIIQRLTWSAPLYEEDISYRGHIRTAYGINRELL